VWPGGDFFGDGVDVQADGVEAGGGAEHPST
jgi:hypothetical protein